MAEVFLARQEGMAGFCRLAVIKKILAEFSSVESVSEMLLDEARIAAQINHPNIVQVFELGKEDGQYFIVMEFVDGCDLATLARIERRRKSRIPLRLTLRVVAEAAMGLDVAHRQVGMDGRPLNLVHRDVSPHNIMVSREGAVKVTDFGIAKAVGKVQVTEAGVVKGKVQYMAPEQYTGESVDNRSDIYSLGVVLYQLSSGRLPRVNKHGELAVQRILEGKIPAPSEIRPDFPPELEAIVLKALAHKPADRYQDAADFRDDLLEFARRNDLLAFPRELGDYVNVLVPAEADDGAEDSAKIGVPAVVVEEVVADGDTVLPGNTEVASPMARAGSAQHRPSLVRPLSEVIQAQQPTNRQKKEDAADPEVSRRVLLTNEGMTPMLDLRPKYESESEPSFQAGSFSAESESGAQRESLAKLEMKTGIELEGSATPTQPLKEPQDGAPSKGPWVVLALALALASAAGAYYWAGRSRVEDDPNTNTKPKITMAGVINVLATPRGAAVSLDGAQRCTTTPCRLDGLPLNRELLVTVKRPGYNIWMQRLLVTDAQPMLIVKAQLTSSTATQPDATARKSPPPKKANTDHRRPANKKRTTRVSPKRGTKPPGKKPPAKTKQVAAAKGSTGRVVVVDAESKETAILVADVRPGWAEVWVDGKRIGATPIHIAIPPGKHVVELKNSKLNFAKRYSIKSVLGKKVKISDTTATKPPAAPHAK